jgi:hypothetical protein
VLQRRRRGDGRRRLEFRVRVGEERCGDGREGVAVTVTRRVGWGKKEGRLMRLVTWIPTCGPYCATYAKTTPETIEGG